jgi:hypothetical protein
MATEQTDRKRKSPEYRLDPLRKWVPKPPIPVKDEYAELFPRSRPRADASGPSMENRRTPVGQAMVDDVPEDGCWYLAAVCYSSGERSAMAGHISRGGYAPNVEVRSGVAGNGHNVGSQREHHVVLLRRKRRTK